MMGFHELIGLSAVKSYIKNAMESGRFSHAYVFAGPAGTGKKTLARLTAKALLCDGGPASGPCGACLSCRSFDSGNHPDVIYIRPDKKKTISADYIREAVINDAAIKPYRSSRKVYIIEKADMMQAASQNIMLKTLEEPLPYGIFLLCAENQTMLLPTVLSRCVTIKLQPPPVSAAAEYILNRRPVLTRDESLFYAELSGGSIGMAMELSEPGDNGEKPLTYRLRESLLNVLEGITGKPPADILMASRVLEEYKESAALLLNLTEAWYRDAAVSMVYCSHSQDKLILRDIAGRVAGEARRLPEGASARAIRMIEDARYQLSYNAGYQLVVETLLLNLRGL